VQFLPLKCEGSVDLHICASQFSEWPTEDPFDFDAFDGIGGAVGFLHSDKKIPVRPSTSPESLLLHLSSDLHLFCLIAASGR
jgi:hypothetical protein